PPVAGRGGGGGEGARVEGWGRQAGVAGLPPGFVKPATARESKAFPGQRGGVDRLPYPSLRSRPLAGDGRAWSANPGPRPANLTPGGQHDEQGREMGGRRGGGQSTAG